MSSGIADPFSKRNLLECPSLVHDDVPRWSLGIDDNVLEAQYFCLAQDIQAQLDTLKTNTFQLCAEEVDLEEISNTPTVVTSRANSIERDTDTDDGSAIWNLGNLEEHLEPGNLVSWDTFANDHRGRGLPPLFCEAGPLPFDAVLGILHTSTSNSRPQLAHTDVYRDALNNLLVGRGSVFFAWDDSLDRYASTYGDVTVSGHSSEIIEKLSAQFCQHGTRFRRLKAMESLSKRPFSSLRTISSAALSVTLAIEEHLDRMQPHKLTILQLSDLRTMYAGVIALFDPYSSFLQAPKSEVDLLTTFVQELDIHWLASQHLRLVIECLVARVLNPILAETTLSLQTSASSEQSSNTDWKLSGLLRSTNPIFEQLTDCNRLLARGNLFGDWTPGTGELRLIFSYTALDNYIQNFAEIERRAVALQQPPKDISATASIPSSLTLSDAILETPFEVNLLSLSRQLNAGILDDVRDELRSAVLDTFIQEETVDTFSLSPIVALDLCVRPYLSMQLRVYSYILLRSLFIQHDLVAEFYNLRAFELLGDQIFTSRLSTALFSPDTTDAGVAWSTDLPAGLHLEDREAWPPASSELRLVLLNVMQESADNDQQCVVDGRMSFAIRDLSDEEMTRCRESRSIHALDFLRISYTPVNDLVSAVISPRSLEIYDRIFRYLLLLLRCKALAQRLTFSHQRKANHSSSPSAPSQTRLFIEMNHFTTAMLDYALTVAIHEPWTILQNNLTTIRIHIDNHDYQKTLEQVGSLAHLRIMHETALDEILSGLMLKQKQATLHTLTIEILTMILQVPDPTVSSINNNHGEVYSKFKRLLGTLISGIEALRSSSKVLSPGTARLECLVARLDLFGYYQSAD